MNDAWASEFQHRMRSFAAAQPHDGIGISLKVRVTYGCFHREHSPHAYALIDSHLASMAREDVDFELLEHESGPEILVYLAFGTAGLALAKSVIDLLVTIVAARRDGIEKGDHPAEPVELIARRVERGDTVLEETILRVGNRDTIDPEQIEALLNAAVERLAAETTDKGG